MCLVDHPFMHCSFTRELWGNLFQKSRDHLVALRLFFNYRSFGNKRELKSLWRCCCFVILWFVWFERNRWIFNDWFLPLEIIWEKAKFLASLRAKANGLFEHATLYDLCWRNWEIAMLILADIFWDFSSLIRILWQFLVNIIFFIKKVY